ncbi:hypothetical protein FDUTEX481_05454 [Tolypothrix sp. PCC 7601]|nr:hypothetical protein FDUTEX481_05454 [Tolypothrix sp. PCC 7601]
MNLPLPLFPLPFSQITREIQNTYPNRIGPRSLVALVIGSGRLPAITNIFNILIP